MKQNMNNVELKLGRKGKMVKGFGIFVFGEFLLRKFDVAPLPTWVCGSSTIAKSLSSIVIIA